MCTVFQGYYLCVFTIHEQHVHIAHYPQYYRGQDSEIPYIPDTLAYSVHVHMCDNCAHVYFTVPKCYDTYGYGILELHHVYAPV